MKTKDKPIVLVALGGHAFMQRGEKGTIEVQERNAKSICQTLMTLVEREYKIVVTHGNGPQVGNLLLLNESGDPNVPRMPLDVLVAQTEGSLGYFLQQAMLNELKERDIKKYVLSAVTQVLVDGEDEAFKEPTKPVGPFLTQEDAEEKKKALGWIIAPDSAGRGWRRLVPSPRPLHIPQRHMIRELAASGHIVIACGGGGIPIVERDDGRFEGVEAVIDKDYTSSLLASEIDAEIFIILTQVPYVYLDFGKPTQRPINAMTAMELNEYLESGDFPPGSMGPKVRATIEFLERGGKRAIITSPQSLESALTGKGGTHIIGGC